MLHFNSSAISDSISVLRPLTGVFKVGQVEINHDVAENIKKVLAHRLDKETRGQLDADVRLLSPTVSGHKYWSETSRLDKETRGQLDADVRLLSPTVSGHKYWSETRRLDKETRAKLDADVRLLSNCERT
ncbi:hypothetical protein RRG08_039346 [Elysia crispata]|uniref:Uncharacterized protein n=1 Tax=Elysia crispata TaxID=231223 RepID=A0AAE0YSS5_9GAST|nr:hypothetical protein RRG08_039346 [Elysia crispata]